MIKRGKFITIEGTEGVGKSTNIEFIKEYLVRQGIPLLLTREPGGTPLAEEIREMLLKRRDEKMDESTELLLIFAARSQHLQQVILPALKGGRWVLSDRFTDATYAYQGGGRGLNISLITDLEERIQGELRPDLTLLLDIDVKLGLERAGRRGELDRFENEQLPFFEKVRKAYLKRIQESPDRCMVIDASPSLRVVQESIKKVLEPKIEEFLAEN
ncbi:dTMP kinase [Candidatus Endobugula sertula]|uniref:Thymidylate kinase n=1 Tax=Candidatus Endobugula sertula TaxID=62101 RepID=A0A1D2QU78_9GAMM|nr:dTMP kinase [Candidatus Endobugula sertula]